MSVNNNTNNPIIVADLPDVDVIRVEDTYYMISTTMHMMPGGVILRSYDLIHWEIASYVFGTLDGTDQQRLIDRKGIYGKGMWAATFRYHEGLFYVIFACNDTKKTYLYTSSNIEGPWKKQNIEGFYHDSSLLFDTDDRVYLAYGNRTIRIIELRKDLSGPLEGGFHHVILEDTEDYSLGFEGAHLYKINGRYYIFLIHWLKNGTGRRVQACYSAERLDGVWTGGDVINDDLGYHNKGVAQGGIVDTPEGKWYGLFFQDHDAVGRIPCIAPMQWKDEMPVFGEDGVLPTHVQTESTRPEYVYSPLVDSDEFDYVTEGAKTKPLKQVWQWNHQPDSSLWSVTERPGYLRLKTDDIRMNVVQAKNTLTQRTLGPYSEAMTRLDASGLQCGDYAGIAAFQSNYGFVGVTKDQDGYAIVMLGKGTQPMDEFGRSKGYDNSLGIEYERIDISEPMVELKVTCDFEESKDEADFYYKRQGEWIRIGTTVHMQYTLDHFMGYRFALTYFSTQNPGGCADFDYFHINTNGDE